MYRTRSVAYTSCWFAICLASKSSGTHHRHGHMLPQCLCGCWFITDRVSMGGNAFASIRLSIHLFPLLSFELTDLWPWLFGCVWITGDWNWRLQVKVNVVSKPSTSIEGSFSCVLFEFCEYLFVIFSSFYYALSCYLFHKITIYTLHIFRSPLVSLSTHAEPFYSSVDSVWDNPG